jgi:FKBP-type peptidyl-prolyl cis-trans isomerase FkpA
MAHQVYKVLFVVLLFSAFLSACSKTNGDVAIVNAQLVKDEALINKYLAANNIKATGVDSAGFATGIYYKIDTLGTANTLYAGSSSVTVSYVGWLLTSNATLGAVVQQSNQSGDTTQYHPSFVLGSVLRGWELGIEGSDVGIGGSVTLYLPSKYAYGPFAQPTLGLPANSVLIFHITVYNVLN